MCLNGPNLLLFPSQQTLYKSCLSDAPKLFHYPGKTKFSPENLSIFTKKFNIFGTRKAEVLNSLIMNITAKANDTNDMLQTFR